METKNIKLDTGTAIRNKRGGWEELRVEENASRRGRRNNRGNQYFECLFLGGGLQEWARFHDGLKGKCMKDAWRIWNTVLRALRVIESMFLNGEAYCTMWLLFRSARPPGTNCDWPGQQPTKIRQIYGLPSSIGECLMMTVTQEDPHSHLVYFILTEWDCCNWDKGE